MKLPRCTKGFLFSLSGVVLLGFRLAIADDHPSLTIDDVFATPPLTGTVPGAPVWSPDSRHFAFTWNNAGKTGRQLWVANRDGSNLRRLDEGSEADEAVREIAWLPDSSGLLSIRADGLWRSELGSAGEARVAVLGANVSDLMLSPNGEHAAYRKDGDLWIYNLHDASVRRLTHVGLAGLSSLRLGRYSRPEREIGPGIWGGPTFAWSPDSRTIAVHLVDRRDMRRVPFPDYLAEETAPNEVRRGYPGDVNESRDVGFLHVASGELKLIGLERPESNQVVNFSWSAEGRLLLDIASDTAVDRWLYVVDRGNREMREIWHSNRSSRIYTAFASTWHPDGQQIVFLSDLGDRYGLYAIDVDTGKRAPRLLTDASVDVLSAPVAIPAAGALFFAANGEGPYERHVYRLDTESLNTNRVSAVAGQNDGFPSPDGRHVAFLHSDDDSPPEIYVAAANGSAVKRVTHSPGAAFNDREWVRSRFVSFASNIDDYTIHARILEPPDLDATRRYPVIFGPMYSNTVRNRWSGIYSMIQQLLVTKGYIVVQVDVRGSTGYGRDFREEFLADFAGDDIEDIVSAVEYMRSLPYVDEKRLGIWGSSYGGTLSIYSLLKKPGLFKAGVAAAAAVDPYFFGTDDVAIVRRPDTHPDVFAKQAAKLAGNLEDHLLIIHGMQDQVVPFKTTAALADVLIRNGKDFEFAFAPGATHAWSREPQYSRYLFTRMLAHFDRYLTPGQGRN